MNTLIVFLTVLAASAAFLLDPVNVSSITPTEFKELFDLIMEEKQLRHVLQHTVEIQQQRLNSYEAAYRTLDAKYRTLEGQYQNLSQANRALEIKYQDLERSYRNISLQQTSQASTTTTSVDIVIKNMSQSIASNNADISALKQTTGLRSGFTVKGPMNGSSGTLGFKTVITNIGGHFEPSNATFTCKFPGIYYFSLSLVKLRTSSRQYDLVSCNIYKNSVNLGLAAYTDPTDDATDGGAYEASGFLVTHLNHGDTINLSGCSTAAALNAYSSFSGFLVSAD